MRIATLRPLFWFGGLLCLASVSGAVLAQQPTGTIAGVVTDPSGAVVPGASVVVINKATQSTIRTTTSSAGVFNVGSHLPGLYEVWIEAIGFKKTVVELKVEVGRVATADVRLEVGNVTETVTVEANRVRVNPTQTALDGVVTEELIRTLPLNGRNFLDLGQLEPGVQVVPDDRIALSGLARLSAGGQTGLSTRVTVDGLDIGDEHGGSVGLNFSASSIREFEISRSSFDISTGLTGVGAVNIVTHSGSNELHGSTFLYWRDARGAARVGPELTPFDREQLGLNLGGPFVRSRLFWFVNYEQNNQDAAVVTNMPMFPQFSRTWPSPFDERMASGRLDWNVVKNVRVFFRFTHNDQQGIPGRSFGGPKLAPILTTNNANQSAVGLEAAAGRFTHSARFGFTSVTRSNRVGGENIPGLPLTVDPAGRLLAVLQAQSDGALGANAILIGAHPNTPKRLPQDTREMRYDMGFSCGRHSLRAGSLLNFIRLNWFETLFANPQINLRINTASINACGSDILCYPALNPQIGNGLGCFTEVPTHGQPCGGGKNSRVHLYAGDTWRAHPRLTVNAGLRWVYEPGPTNADLQRPAILESFLPGLSRPRTTDKNNFAPQFGVAWTPSSSGKWVIRAGGGLFYETNRLQNVMFGERVNLLPLGVTGDFQSGLIRDPNTNRVIFDIQGRNWLPPDGPALVTPGVNWFGRPLGTPGLLDAVFAARELYEAAALVAFANFPAGPSSCEFRRSCRVIAPGYVTPYSAHMNVGFQRELRRELVLSVDYIRQRGLHFMMRRDANRVGAADTLNVTRAQAAMNTVHIARGCPQGAAGVDCAIAAGATLTAYVNAGLSSSATASILGPSTSAFAGANPNFGDVTLLTMDGFSNYNALHVNLRGRLPDLGRAVRNPFVIVSYALGRLEGTAEDQAIINLVDRTDKNSPSRFRGPTSLDRTHILSVAGLVTIPGGVQINSLWKAFSALPQTVSVPQVVGGAGEIFHTDFNGDGNSTDLLPGTNRGSYGRKIGCGGAALNRVIDRYNSTQAGNLTLAGQALVDAGLFRRDQLVTLGAVSPTVAHAPEGQVCLDSFLTTDVRISRPFKLRGERITIEPALEWFNLFNVANYDLPDNKLSGVLSTAVGSLNGTTVANRPNRAGGTGSFVLGAPRSWQLVLRVSF